MRIRIHSDLHEEFRERFPPFDLPHLPVDVTVLAGDIANGTDVLDVARRDCFAGSIKLIVPGNHEFYGNCVPRLRAALQDATRGSPDLIMLDEASIVIGGVRFIGATLWTDFQLYGPLGEATARRIATATMPDYRLIEIEPGRRMSVDDAQAMHASGRAFIERTLAEPFAGPTVCITHHAPHPNSIAARFADDPVNPAFISDLSALMRCDLWIHGHTHNSFDYRIGRTRVLANPAGYRKLIKSNDVAEAPQVIYENSDFDPGFTVVIDSAER